MCRNQSHGAWRDVEGWQLCANPRVSPPIRRLSRHPRCPFDDAGSDRRTPEASRSAGVRHRLAGERNDEAVAAVLPLLTNPARDDPDGRMEEQDRLNNALEKGNRKVEPADMGQLVEQRHLHQQPHQSGQGATVARLGPAPFETPAGPRPRRSPAHRRPRRSGASSSLPPTRAVILSTPQASWLPPRTRLRAPLLVVQFPQAADRPWRP